MHRSIRFLDYVLEMLNQANPIQKSNPDGDWFTLACKMLTHDLHHKVDWQLIANELGMNYNTFRLYFTRRAGMPPMRYRDKARIQKACSELTQNIHKSCKEIAFNLGYNDAHHFSIHFKKHMNMSPSEYRQKYRNQK